MKIVPKTQNRILKGTKIEERTTKTKKKQYTEIKCSNLIKRLLKINLAEVNAKYFQDALSKKKKWKGCLTFWLCTDQKHRFQRKSINMYESHLNTTLVLIYLTYFSSSKFQCDFQFTTQNTTNRPINKSYWEKKQQQCPCSVIRNGRFCAAIGCCWMCSLFFFCFFSFVFFHATSHKVVEFFFPFSLPEKTRESKT